LEWQAKHKDWFKVKIKDSNDAEFLNLLASGEGFTIYQKADKTDHVMKTSSAFTKTDLLIRENGDEGYVIDTYDKTAGRVKIFAKEGGLFSTYQLKGYEVQVDAEGNNQLVHKILKEETQFLGPINFVDADKTRDFYVNKFAMQDAYNRQMSILAREIKNGKAQVPAWFTQDGGMGNSLDQAVYKPWQPLDVEKRVNEILDSQSQF